MNFVVDTWVLHRADENQINAIDFLNSFKKGHKIFIDKNSGDNKSKILTEYRSVHGLFISQWLKSVLPKRIIKVVIKKRCKNFLKCKRDMKFVYVCLNSKKVNRIVSEDHDFSNNSDSLLAKGINLLDIENALLVS